MQRIKTEQELEMRRLSKEQELEMRRLESKQKELDRKHRLKAYAEMERKISEFNAEFYQNIQEEKELPNEDTVKQKRNEIRRNVLVAYGLSEDPLSNLVKTNTPVVEYKIVVAPSTGWSIPIGGTQIVPTNLTLEDILLFPENPSVHSANFTTMIKLGMKIFPNRMPNQILFCAIGIYDPFTFSNEFSSILQESYVDILEELKEKINSLTT